ncbi:response regulator [Treponema sp. OttesenSCG-928-L16]|nr:response regulator [Treponema sp. OttesenSCG-928-L16]
MYLLLIVLSVSAIVLGIYVLDIGRRSSWPNWNYLALALTSAVWCFGAALYYLKFSQRVSSLGIYIVETSIAVIFPILTVYLSKVLGVSARSFLPTLFLQMGAAVLLILTFLLQPFFTVHLNGPDISLEMQYGYSFFICAAYSLLSPLINIAMIFQSYRNSEYKRDRHLAMSIITALVFAVFFLQMRFFVHIIYGYGCCLEFICLVILFNFSRKYNASVINYRQAAEYVYSSVSTPLLVLNPKGSIILANNSAAQFLGRNTRKLLGMDIQDFLIFERTLEKFSKTADAGNSISHYDAVTISGNVKCDVELTYIYDSYKELLYVVLLIYDLTDKMKLIEELEAEKEKAEAASRSKSAFLANTSHEIRTPMNAIVGMSELILREELPPSIYEHVMGIKHASANLLSIINDILDFSKIESGKMEIIPAAYTISSMVNDVVNIIRMKVTEKPLAFITFIDSNLPNNLIGDEIRLRQIMMNLLGNAVKYTRDGYISLSIDGTISGPETVELRITVSDSGIGIKEEDMEKLFGNFSQLDTQRNRGIEGSGLGLAISRSLCHAMGGDICLSSVYGQGSTFTARIPQKIRSRDRVAEIKDPEQKKCLVYESRRIYGDSIVRSLDNLGIENALVHKQSDFYEALRNGYFPYILISRLLFENSGKNLLKQQNNSKLIVIGDYESVTSMQQVSVVPSPVHCISLAGILSNKNTGISAEPSSLKLHFIAPAARILVVDDINTNLKVAEGFMSPYRMRIDTCRSGAEAISFARKYRYDLIFMDHMMPEMDGIETAAFIRTLPDNKGYYATAPIIALTANAVSGMREMFIENGFNDFLSKPIEIHKLNSLLEKWIPQEKKRTHFREAVRDNSAPFFEIDGLDVRFGISMTGGDTDGYVNTLKVYIQDTEEKIGKITECLETGDLRQYAVHVHALKSASASIGAAELSELAKALEFAGKNEDRRFIDLNTPIFFEKLKRIISLMDSVIRERGTGNSGKDGQTDLALLKIKCSVLKEALDKMDMGTVNSIIDEMEKTSWGEKPDEAIKAISRNILLSDYETAVQEIEDLLTLI